jgi:protein phosphatase
MTTPDSTPAVDSPSRIPRDDEVDVFGLTHLGKARKTNQDNFLICSLHKQMRVHYTSLPEVARLPLWGERLAYLAMVADGVGSGLGGGEASRHTIEVVAQYVTESMHCYYTADATDEQAFSEALQEAAMHCHQSVAEKAEADPDRRGMATTLTMLITVWPVTYLLQVGDSRCYILREGTLTQITRDQTMAQELVDQGVLTVSNADNTQWAHVLSSAIGGSQTAPVVTRIDRAWDDVILLCSDGLTKHVSDNRIREQLSTMKSSQQVCEDLLQEALDGGGSDNITVLVGRLVGQESE